MSSCPLRKIYPPEIEWTTFCSTHRTVWPSTNAPNDDPILALHPSDGPIHKHMDSHPSDAKIHKPKGEVGCLSKGGYRLRKVLGWENEFYNAVQACLCSEHIYHH